MIIKVDKENWLGADGIQYSTAELAHTSFKKAREAYELHQRLKELEAFPSQHGFDPRTSDRPLPPRHARPSEASSRSSPDHYDVALSFAGENRDYVRAVAEGLRDARIKVFYDDFFKVDLWGKDLFTYLSDLYRNRSTYTVIFASHHYAKKAWTNHELKSAQSRAIEEIREYILPARFDDTEIPGVLGTTGYIDLRLMSPGECAELIVDKVKGHASTVVPPPISRTV